jgi:hypothetical protein
MGEQSINLQINANGEIIPCLMPLESIREEETERRDRSYKKDHPKMRLQARPTTATRRNFGQKKQTMTPERLKKGQQAVKPQQNFLRASKPLVPQKVKQRPQTAKPKQQPKVKPEAPATVLYQAQFPTQVESPQQKEDALESLKHYVRPMTAALRKNPSSFQDKRGFIKKQQTKPKKSDPV